MSKDRCESLSPLMRSSMKSLKLITLASNGTIDPMTNFGSVGKKSVMYLGIGQKGPLISRRHNMVDFPQSSSPRQDAVHLPLEKQCGPSSVLKRRKLIQLQHCIIHTPQKKKAKCKISVSVSGLPPFVVTTHPVADPGVEEDEVEERRSSRNLLKRACRAVRDFLLVRKVVCVWIFG